MSASSFPLVLPKVQDTALETTKYQNLLRALRNRRLNAARLDHTPLDITVDMCTACHLRCPYCATGSGVLDRRAQVLDLEEHRRILDFCGEQLFTIWYFSNGEPLLNKRLHRIVADAKRYGIFTVISTSLSVPLSDTRIDEILYSGLDLISCSIDGPDAATYNRYRIGGDFNLVQRNLERLIARKRELGLQYPLIEWRYLVFRHNQDLQAETRRMAHSKGVDILELFQGSAPAQAPEGAVAAMTGALLSPAISGPAVEAGLRRRDTLLRRHLPELSINPGEPGPGLLGRKCDWLYFGSMFYPDGSVGPCCVLGNSDTDFGQRGPGLDYRALWNNPKYLDARASFPTPPKPSHSICAHCPAPQVQDWFFRQSLRAYLLNAPEWFIQAVLAEPEQLFYPVDLYMMPDEFMALKRYQQAKPSVRQAGEPGLDCPLSERDSQPQPSEGE
ncbi:radical SAM/SPASM domain-containing protein [Methylomagnum ishizawai]|uniref:radical SAM/SPASM domain-containing protein n=1 Tax=Methylomagnum ishizawai TaxID=1760988 RepID=UPI001C3402D7|nr:radical SAM protein [Methylomagnum ishizawai]BBL73448.1 hypothetical protein MishRS11D_05460 [Methylomagnum ishizawai]